jgi:adenylate kinase
MPVIIVTGTPGTGKTTVAKQVSKALKLKYIDVNMLIKEKNLATGYDKKRGCAIIDDKKLKIELMALAKSKNAVIDSHMSHLLPAKYANLCIVTKCSLKVLKKRLQRRKYSTAKVRENLDAEIFDNCLVEARENDHKILIIDTTKKSDYTNKIKQALK